MAKIIFTKEPQGYNQNLAEALKKIPDMKAPEWSEYVKTGVAKKRVPMDSDFWYKRAASILRQLYIHGVVGVGKLKTRYGSRKNRGAKPARFKEASGKIIRTILQQAEKAKLVEKLSSLQFGRRLTQTGRDFLDSIEVVVKESKPIEFIEKKSAPEKVSSEEEEKEIEVEEEKPSKEDLKLKKTEVKKDAN